MPKIFQLGPEPIYGNNKGMFVTQANDVTAPHQTIGGQHLIGKECHSVADFEVQVKQMKHELDLLVLEARQRFSAS